MKRKINYSILQHCVDFHLSNGKNGSGPLDLVWITSFDDNLSRDSGSALISKYLEGKKGRKNSDNDAVFDKTLV